MPTEVERNGDFSQDYNLLGQPVQISDPLTGLPFDGNEVPPERISPQSKALLNGFPLPNFNANAGYNYQIPIVAITHQDSIQGRLNKSINSKNQLGGNIATQSARNDNSDLFHFLDKSRTCSISARVQWTTRPTQRFMATLRRSGKRRSC